MLKRAVIAVLAGAFLAAPALAQDKTLEEVLESYYEAVGGLDAWKGLETLRASGKMQMQGNGDAADVDRQAPEQGADRVHDAGDDRRAGVRRRDGVDADAVHR